MEAVLKGDGSGGDFIIVIVNIVLLLSLIIIVSDVFLLTRTGQRIYKT